MSSKVYAGKNQLAMGCICCNMSFKGDFRMLKMKGGVLKSRLLISHIICVKQNLVKI